jgi:hypothetical protein
VTDRSGSEQDWNMGCVFLFSSLRRMFAASWRCV